MCVVALLLLMFFIFFSFLWCGHCDGVDSSDEGIRIKPELTVPLRIMRVHLHHPNPKVLQLLPIHGGLIHQTPSWHQQVGDVLARWMMQLVRGA